MTAAILIWQAIIFLTIALSGRWKGWVTAFWVIWTIVQVATLPLSVIQFGTIALAFFLVGRGEPREIAPTKPDPDAERHRLEAERLQQEKVARFLKTRDERRKQGGVGLLLWGACAAGAFYWFNAYGVNALSFLAFSVSAFMFLLNLNRVLG